MYMIYGHICIYIYVCSLILYNSLLIFFYTKRFMYKQTFYIFLNILCVQIYVPVSRHAFSLNLEI